MKFALAVCAAVLLALPGPSGAASIPPGGVLKFDVLRGGDIVGSHVPTFADGGRSGDIQTKIAVKLVFITVYRFELDAHEEWRGGRLLALKSKSNNDGIKHTLSASASEAGLAVTVDGKLSRADAAIVPATLWREETVSQRVLLNTLDGSLMNISVTDHGQDAIEAAGATVTARHYVLTGDLEREPWYDAKGMLVHIRLAGSDGSVVDYRLR